MAVTRCALDYETAPADFDERNRGVYKLRYNVVCNSSMSPRLVASGALVTGPHPLPSLWTSYSYQGDNDPYSFARQFSVRRRHPGQNLTHWTIDVDYRPLDDGENSDTAEPNPLLRDPWYDWDSEFYTERVWQDKDGNPIKNLAGQRYDDVIEEEASRGILLAMINVATLGEVIAEQRAHQLRCNETEFDLGGETIAPRQAFCRRVQSQKQQTEGGSTYFTITYAIAIKNEGETWDEEILEQGFEHFKHQPGCGGYELILDANGNRKLFNGSSENEGSLPYASPVLLAEDGTRLPDGEPAIFTAWEIKKESEFNDMLWLV